MSEDKYTQTFGRSVLVDFLANVATAVAVVDAILKVDPNQPHMQAYRDTLMRTALIALTEEDLSSEGEEYTWTDDECADRAVAIADYLREEKRLLSDEYDLLGYSELPEGDEGVTLWIGKADAVNAMWDTLVMLTANYLHMIDNTKEDDDEVE